MTESTMPDVRHFQIDNQAFWLSIAKPTRLHSECRRDTGVAFRGFSIREIAMKQPAKEHRDAYERMKAGLCSGDAPLAGIAQDLDAADGAVTKVGARMNGSNRFETTVAKAFDMKPAEPFADLRNTQQPCSFHWLK